MTTNDYYYYKAKYNIYSFDFKIAVCKNKA